jgi:tricorn protease
VAYWSDRTGEYELYVRPADGTGEERRLTTDGAGEPVWRYGARWSPDGSKLAYGDRRTRLRVVDAESGEITDVDHDPKNDITDYRWSPDSRWLAYSKVGDNQLSSVWVHSLEQGESFQLTGDDTHDLGPAWDPKGRYLYFLSDRDFNLTFSGFEFDFLYTNPERVYVGLLTEDAAPLFLPESDEEPAGGGEGGKGDGAEDGEEGKAGDDELRVAVDPEGFDRRVRAIPGPSGNYGSLEGVAAGVLYLEAQSPQGGPANLQLFDLEAEEEKTVLEGVAAYRLAAGGEKVGYAAFGPGGMTYGIAPVQPGQTVDDTKLDLSGLELKIDPRAEWRQEFVDAWRILRDWFYDPGMHGLDWQGLRERYEPLVGHLAHRSDLDYILGELGAELGAGHVYVQPSDDWQIERRENALLGAEIAADPSGYFRVDTILPGENWHEDFRSPLTEPGVDVNEGDLILSVDGVSTRSVDNFYQLLENKADRVITLEVAADASGAETRTARVRPITRDTNLRYLDWVESRRRYVDEASGGRIGYIHLPNTAVEGSRELWKGFYAQANRDALILDDRYNGGGFIPYGMIELLERPLMSYWSGRHTEPFTTPQFVHRGPKAMLANGNAGSGGDALPYYFRERGLGPVIGTRTWGGLIGVSGNPGLVDGGLVTAPTFRFIDLEGMWAVEGIGVEPDIEVIDRPDLVARGIDPSLDKAIEVLLEELEENPVEPLTVPEPPEVQ